MNVLSRYVTLWTYKMAETMYLHTTMAKLERI